MKLALVLSVVLNVFLFLHSTSVPKCVSGARAANMLTFRPIMQPVRYSGASVWYHLYTVGGKTMSYLNTLKIYEIYDL